MHVFSTAIFLFLTMACNDQTPEIQVKATVAPAPSTPNPDSLNYLLGRFDPATHPDFVAVEKPYTQRPEMRLRREAMEAFKKMYEAAKKEGVQLQIISSTRNFNQQKAIWEGKWKRFAKDAPQRSARALKILEYSSMPGSSRHHWGTDIDLNDLNNEAFEKGGRYEKVYQWLAQHAHEYGFCQPYTAGRPHGYHEEKWHWSYTPLSSPLLQQYRNQVHDSDITGFEGADLAAEIHIIEYFVLGINTECF